MSATCSWLAAGAAGVRRPDPALHSGSPAPTGRSAAGCWPALREAAGPVAPARLDALWPDPAQRARALDSLVAHGLVDPLPDGTYALPR